MRSSTMGQEGRFSSRAKRHVLPPQNPSKKTKPSQVASSTILETGGANSEACLPWLICMSADEEARPSQWLQAPALFDLYGVLVFRDPKLAGGMPPAVRKAALRAATPIFDSHVTLSSAAAEVGDLLVRTHHDQRNQAVYSSTVAPARGKKTVKVVPEPDRGVLAEWGKPVEDIVMQHARSVVPTGLKIKAATIICNKLPVGQEGKPQQLHTDVHPLGRDKPQPAPVVILAVDAFFLLVCPTSHRTVQLMKDLEASCDGKPAATQDCAFSILPTSCVYLLDLQPGDCVVMHGYCVHAGYSARPGAADIRAHWYMEIEGSNAFVYDETYNIEGDPENPLREKFDWTLVRTKVSG